MATGKKRQTFYGPDWELDWGFIAVVDNRLYGSKQSPNATWSDATAKTSPFRSMWSASEAEFVLSRQLFALDKATGQTIWNRPGAILNASITLADGKVYFVESRDPKMMLHPDGSVWLRDALGPQTWLVALDGQTGQQLWEQPFAPPARSMLYLSARRGLLVASYSYHVGPKADAPPVVAATSKLIDDGESPPQVTGTLIRFGFQALDAATGQVKWTTDEYTSKNSLGAQHNYNISHPVFTDTTIYHNPAEQYLVTLDLLTGQLREMKHIARSKGCATPTGSARAIFYRSTGIASFDFASETQFYVSDVSRPSCWISVLPAGGLLLMPEYSIGCNCAFPLQTTIVLVPGSFAHEPPPRRR